MLSQEKIFSLPDGIKFPNLQFEIMRQVPADYHQQITNADAAAANSFSAGETAYEAKCHLTIGWL